MTDRKFTKNRNLALRELGHLYYLKVGPRIGKYSYLPKTIKVHQVSSLPLVCFLKFGTLLYKKIKDGPISCLHSLVNASYKECEIENLNF